MKNVHYVVAKNEVEAKFLAMRKFSSGERCSTSILTQATSKQKVYKAVLTQDGNVIVSEHKN